jgi:hypothetical protein
VGDRVTVAYIGATGRSGSTLLDRVLGTAPSAVSVGELTWIWNYGVISDRPCGCGEPFRSCPFWTSVGDAAFGGWHQVDAEGLNRTRRELLRNRSVPTLWPRRSGGGAAAHEYVDVLGRLYRSIASVSGVDVVVDNSKQVSRRSP